MNLIDIHQGISEILVCQHNLNGNGSLREFHLLSLLFFHLVSFLHFRSFFRNLFRCHFCIESCLIFFSISWFDSESILNSQSILKLSIINYQFSINSQNQF